MDRTGLRYLAGALAVAIAAIHIGSDVGFRKLVFYAQVGQFPDPRPFLFVGSGMAIFLGIARVLDGHDPAPVYLAGIALMLAYAMSFGLEIAMNAWLPNYYATGFEGAIGDLGFSSTEQIQTAAGTFAALAAGVALPAGAPTGTGLPPWTPAFVGGVATLSLCSHVAGDAITPMGIRPFRPLSAWHVTLDLTPAANPRANRLFLGVGAAALALSVGLTP